MSKRIAVGILVVLFSIGLAGTGFAKKVKCTVDSVEGDKVTMTCEDADKMSAGDKVKVSLPKGGAIEGC